MPSMALDTRFPAGMTNISALLKSAIHHKYPEIYSRYEKFFFKGLL